MKELDKELKKETRTQRQLAGLDCGRLIELLAVYEMVFSSNCTARLIRMGRKRPVQHVGKVRLTSVVALHFQQSEYLIPGLNGSVIELRDADPN